MALALGDNQQIKQITNKDQQIFLADPQQLNSYSYASNNPIIKFDPSGKYFQFIALAIGTLAMYAPQITSYRQTLLTPMGQMGVNQATQDAKQGNYIWAVFGFVTAGETSVGGYKPAFEGLWSTGKQGNRAANAAYHALEAGKDGVGHAAEFGLKSTKNYILKTREFITDAINKGFQTKLESREGFDILRTYDKGTNTFSVFEVNKSTNGITPRSMFKPESPNYFDSSAVKGKLIDIKSYLGK